MRIKKAEIEDVDAIHAIVYHSISNTFANYYPQEVVEFILDYHKIENIKQDILRAKTYTLSEGNNLIGTGSINGAEINRVFLLPHYQGKGYGSKMMDFPEKEVFKKSNKVRLEASLPASKFYLNRGYKLVEFQEYPVSNGRFFFYPVLEKQDFNGTGTQNILNTGL